MNITDDADLNKEWVFSEREITISDKIIGKGAFGEVRVAKWRNIDVAAKRLHALVAEQDSELRDLQYENASIADSFRAEMHTLSKMRHPNLVLFLGIGYNPRTRQPTTILTELLPGSLYDVLEVHKIKLNIPEILDIALDVATGLDYLHSHNPQVVHRDISAKNILLGGNRAKIADLGQAKIFGASALSRQTSMPGAMAYSAPEVLTGKYTSKIDIFSFGILLIQMCCGEYPRIDRREDQQRLAIQRCEPLDNLLRTTISYQPNERPSASAVCLSLKDVISNDRYYPPSRRLPPQCDIGVMARRWLDESLEERAGDIRLALEQTSRRLAVEEQRWRDEAGRVDGILRKLDDANARVAAAEEEAAARVHECEELRGQLREWEERGGQKEQRIQSLLQEKETVQQVLEETRAREKRAEEELQEVKVALESLKEKNNQVMEEFREAKHEETTSKSNENNLKFQLEMQVDQSRELEMRLEQTLVRWKQEKEMVMMETERCTRLRVTCAELVEKELRTKEEIDRLTRRLNMYDSLPLPDEIRARFQDLEDDIRTKSDENDALRSVKHEQEVTIEELREKLRSMTEELSTVSEERNSLQGTCDKLKDDVSRMESNIETLNKQLSSCSFQIERLESDKKNLISITETIRNELHDAKESVEASKISRRRAEQLYAELKQKVRVGDVEVTANESKDTGGSVAGSAALSTIQSPRVCGMDAEEDNEYADDDDFGGEETDAFDSGAPIPIDQSSDTRQRILHDREQLRRYSINTRLRKVKEGDVGTAENDALSTDSVSRFHTFGGGNVTDLIRTAKKTKENLEKLQRAQSLGHDQDEMERKREMDSAAKLRILQAREHGGVANIIRVMWENLDCEHTTWRGARAVRDLFVKDDVVRKQCVEHKCEEILIAGLAAFPESSTVQGQCLRALAALVFGNDVVRRHCGEKGAMRRIVISLETHTDDENVILHACTALTNLAHNSADNRGRFQEAGGVDALLVAMAAHRTTSAKIQRQACWAILTLAGSDGVSREIVSQGGDEKIMTAMVLHKNDAGVQQFGCWAISNLALAGDDIRLKIRKCGIMEVCSIALETHAENMEVVRQARHAIGVLGPLNDIVSPEKPKSRRKTTMRGAIRRESKLMHK